MTDELDELIEQVFARLAHGDVGHRAWLAAELRNTFSELVQPHIEARCEDAAKAERAAVETLRQFLTDSGIKFGDPAYDWTRAGAIDLIHEYELHYWEPA